MWSCVRIPCLCLCLFMLPACSLCVALPVLRCQELFSALLCMLLPSLPWVLSPCFLLSPCCLASAGLSSWLVTFFFSVQHTFVHNENNRKDVRRFITQTAKTLDVFSTHLAIVSLSILNCSLRKGISTPMPLNAHKLGAAFNASITLDARGSRRPMCRLLQFVQIRMLIFCR